MRLEFSEIMFLPYPPPILPLTLPLLSLFQMALPPSPPLPLLNRCMANQTCAGVTIHSPPSTQCLWGCVTLAPMSLVPPQKKIHLRGRSVDLYQPIGLQLVKKIQ